VPYDRESFGESYQQDAGLADLVFYKDKISNINQAPLLRMEKAMQLSEEVKKAMTVTSWSLWFTEANQKLLQILYDKVDKGDPSVEQVLQELKMTLNLNCSILNATKDAAFYESSALVTNTLAQRDCYIDILDREVSEETKLDLRASSFMGETLFAGKVRDAKGI